MSLEILSLENQWSRAMANGQNSMDQWEWTSTQLWLRMCTGASAEDFVQLALSRRGCQLRVMVETYFMNWITECTWPATWGEIQKWITDVLELPATCLMWAHGRACIHSLEPFPPMRPEEIIRATVAAGLPCLSTLVYSE